MTGMKRALVLTCLLLLSVPAATWSAQGGDRRIKMYDDCEQQSFDAVIGEGTCVGDGRTTFEEFVAELEATQDAEDWNFNRERTKVREERSIVVDNEGGEVHTFTEVDEFGGGFIDFLNQISGNPVPAPECERQDPGPFVPAGGSVTLPAGEAGEERNFMCCIHPWMRSTVAVR